LSRVDGSLLVVGVITKLHHLLLQSVETESKVINVLTWLKDQVLPLLVKCLQRGLTDAVATDACGSDGVPGLLGSPLLGKRELHLRRDCSNEGIQRASILVVVDVAIPNCFPHVPHLEPYPHHRDPLDVVGLGEGRLPTVGIGVPDNGLDPMVTMVPVRGGRVAPPVKATISVDLAAGASVPVWAAAAVRGTTAARAPARSTAGAFAPVWATATTPLGVHGCPLCCLPRQLELVVFVTVGRNRVAVATGTQSLELCCRRTRCICRRCCFFCPCCCQFYHHQPCRRRYSLCHCSLAFLCRGILGLLPVLRARGDRALRLSFGHDTLVGGCCVGKMLPQTSCYSAEQERRYEQGQLVSLLPAEGRERCGEGMSRRCLSCRIERL
jgi:hypothetical protein